MRPRIRPAYAIVAGLVSLVWLGQGLGLIRGSYMSGRSEWAVIGAILLVASAAVLWLSRRSKRGGRPRGPDRS
jgi:F0F1-type ATP synthase assembly protein I